MLLFACYSKCSKCLIDKIWNAFREILLFGKISSQILCQICGTVWEGTLLTRSLKFLQKYFLFLLFLENVFGKYLLLGELIRLWGRCWLWWWGWSRWGWCWWGWWVLWGLGCWQQWPPCPFTSGSMIVVSPLLWWIFFYCWGWQQNWGLNHIQYFRVILS